MPTLLIRNARVLVTMDHGRREINGGAIFVRDGAIEQVGPTSALPNSADRVIDASDQIVLPGLVNTHHHMYQSLTRVVPAAGRRQIAQRSWLHLDRFEFGMLWTAKVFGTLCNFGTLVLVTRAAALGRRPEHQSWLPVPALYLATLAPFLVWGVGALETPLLTLLITATVYLHLREDVAARGGLPGVPWSYLALLFSALTRPEPVLLFPLLAGVRFVRSQQQARRRPLPVRELGYLALFAAPYAAFIAWRWHYYGQFVPNTYFAKVSGDNRTLVRGFWYLRGTLVQLNGLGLILLGGVFGLLARRVSYRVCALLVLCLSQLLIVFLEGGDWMVGYRLLVPALPLVALLIDEAWLVAGSLSFASFTLPSRAPSWLIRAEWLERWNVAVHGLERALPHWTSAGVVAGGARLILSLLLITGSVTSFDSARVRTFVSGLRGFSTEGVPHLDVARWMVREVHDSGLLALGEAGVIPYYTRLPIIDLHGLMDAHIAHLPGGLHHKYDADYVFARRPKYAFSPVLRGKDGRISSVHSYATSLLVDALRAPIRATARLRNVDSIRSEVGLGTLHHSSIQDGIKDERLAGMRPAYLQSSRRTNQMGHTSSWRGSRTSPCGGKCQRQASRTTRMKWRTIRPTTWCTRQTFKMVFSA